MVDTRLLLRVLLVLTPALYAAAWCLYVLVFFNDSPEMKRAARPLLTVAAATHLAYLLGFTLFFQHLPLVNGFQLAGAIGFAVAATYLWVEGRAGSPHTGPFVLFIVLAFVSVSLLDPRLDHAVPVILQSKLFSIHVSAAVLGYSAFALAAVFGLLYLMQYYGLRAGRFGLVFRRLPSLGILDRMNLYAAILGFVFLTVAISVGGAWSARVFGGVMLDPKVAIALAAWLVYGLTLMGRRLAWWSETQMAYSTLFGFGIVLFSMFVVNYWSRFHVFTG